MHEASLQNTKALGFLAYLLSTCKGVLEHGLWQFDLALVPVYNADEGKDQAPPTHHPNHAVTHQFAT